MRDLLDDFTQTMRRLTSPALPVVAAVSGGVDSMVLLDLLARANWNVVVAHFNHQLRGNESDEDEAFVREAAKALGFSFKVERGDVRAAAKGVSIEMAARKLRHEFLARVARETNACVALAHHADDQIELFVMRLMRGVEGAGLGGMRMSSPSPADREAQLLRPLLETRRADVVAYARERGLQWREDSSNRELHAERNKARNVILPALRAAERNVDADLLAQVRAQQELADALKAAARDWLSAGLPAFEELPAALRREVVVAQLHKEHVAPTASLLNELLSTGVTSVNARIQARLDSSGKLRLSERRNEEEMRIDLSSDGAARFAGFEVSWRHSSSADDKPVAGKLVFDADRLGPVAVLRKAQPGDRIQLSGRSSARPVAEMFSRNKIPREGREGAIVGANARGEIFWASPLRITEQFKIRPETKRFIVWNWRAT